MQRGSGALGKRVLILAVAACAVLAIAVSAWAIDPPQPGPSITGTAAFGQPLTGNDGTWTGDPAPTLSRAWLRCDPSGAPCAATGDTDNGYTPGAADAGQILRFQVSGDNGDGAPVIATSDGTAPVTRPATNTALPTVTGTATAGQSLTHNAGAWVGFPAPAISQQWLRCNQGGGGCAAVGSGGMYPLTAADVGSTIRTSETGTNSTGSQTVNSAQTAVVTGPPVLGTQPTIDNASPLVGQTITATPGTAGGFPVPAPSFVWQRCDNAAGGNCAQVGTGAAYTAVPADAGKFLRVQVTWTNGVAPPAVSAWVQTAQAVRQAPVNTAPPALSNSSPIFPGDVTVQPGTWQASPPVTGFLFDWLRCVSADPASCQSTGGTAATYTLQQADVGFYLRVKVTAQNGVPPEGVVAFTPVTSAPVRQAPVNSGADPMKAPFINDGGDGVVQRGETLTGDSGVWFAFPAPTAIAHQWQRCPATGGLNQCVPVGDPVAVTPAATGPFSFTGVSQYVLTDADLGSRMRLVVTVANGLGPPVSLATTAATAPVRGGPVNRADLGGGSPTLTDGDGAPKRGETMTATSGLWTGYWAVGAAPVALTHTWQRCPADGNAAGCVDIAAPLPTPIAPAGASTCPGPAGGAAPPTASPCGSASVLPLTDADLGSRIRVVVTASNGGGNAQLITPMSAVVLGPPIIPQVNGQPNPELLPEITGAAQHGLTLVASTGSWSAFPMEGLTYSYEWLRCSGAGVDSCSAIGGATTDVYAVSGADVGSTLRVRVTAKNGVLPDGVALSQPTTTVTTPPGGPPGPGGDMVLQLSQSSSGGQVKYTLNLRNVGTAAAEGVSVKATLAPQLSLVSATASAGSCAAGVTCSIGNVAAGGSARVEITARASQTGTYPFSASVSSASPDVNPTNNSISTSTRVTVQSERGPAATTDPRATTTPVGKKATSAVKKVTAKLRAKKVGKTWVVKTRFSLVSGKAKLVLTVTPNGSTKKLRFLKGSRLGKSVAKKARKSLSLNAPKPATFPVKIVMAAKGFARKKIYVIRIKATAPNGLFSQLDIGFNGAKVLGKRAERASKQLTRLTAVLTPRGAVALRRASGKKVRKLEPGGYLVRVRDSSSRCGLRFRNGKVTRRTGVAFVGRKAWRVRIGAGRLTLRCGPRGLSVPVA